jgi:hypothetical protein
MIRTQIYITEQERSALARLARQLDKSQSDLIRQAIDLFCAARLQENRASIMQNARGIWEKRTDLPNFAELRRELDRPKKNKKKKE